MVKRFPADDLLENGRTVLLDVLTKPACAACEPTTAFCAERIGKTK